MASFGTSYDTLREAADYIRKSVELVTQEQEEQLRMYPWRLAKELDDIADRIEGEDVRRSDLQDYYRMRRAQGR